MNNSLIQKPSPMNSTNPTSDCPSFEDALTNLETIVHELEEGQIGLADALTRYEQGVKLLKQCYGMLEGAERKIELLSGIDAAGNPLTQAYDDEATAERDQRGESRSKRRSARPQAEKNSDLDALPDRKRDEHPDVGAGPSLF
jgi:exodeoxyribonuclease VII small subunit